MAVIRTILQYFIVYFHFFLEEVQLSIFSRKRGGGHLLIWTIFLLNIYLQLGIEDFEYVALITLKIPKHVVVNFEFFKLFVKNYKGV